MKNNFQRSSSIYVDRPITSMSQILLMSWSDIILTFFGLFAAVLSGICIPGIIILYGNLAQVFLQYEIHSTSLNATNYIPVAFRRKFDSTEIASSQLSKQTLDFSVSSGALAFAQLIFTSTYIVCLGRASLNFSNRAREIYFDALLSQSISWFDLQNAPEVATDNIRDMNYLETSVGEKFGTFVSSTIAACTCTLVALYYGYELTAQLFTIVPIVAIIIYVAKRINNLMKKKEDSFYRPAENVIRESLSNLSSIMSYSGERNECKKYVEKLAPVEDIRVTKNTINCFADAILSVIIYCTYAFAFFRGVQFMKNDYRYNVANLIVIFLCVQIAVLHILQLPRYFFLLGKANLASKKIIEMISRVPKPEMNFNWSENNKSDFAVSFENVGFSYFFGNEKMIFDDVSFKISRGNTVAIVGPANSGKTTCLSLIHRFYEPRKGKILLDGIDIGELNKNWLRKYVGYAQQCPVLFGATIVDAIICHSSYKSLIHLETVSKIVGLDSVVMQLPEKYNSPLTMDLSVDQRQRIALARVLYRKPKILLIDNALSSLSPESEAKIFNLLCSNFADTTILIVTNNQEILKKVEKILFLENGKFNEFNQMENMTRFHPTSQKIINERSNVQEMAVETTLKCKNAASTSKKILSNLSNFQVQSYQELLRSELVRIGRYPVFFQVTDIPTTDNILSKDLALASTKKLIFYNKKEWMEILLASIAGGILGFSLPIYTVLFGETLSLVALENGNELRIRLHFFTNMFLVAAFVSGICTIIQGYMLAIAGSKLTTRIRKKAFRKILEKNLEFFDCEKNDAEEINFLLKNESTSIEQACGQKIILIVQALTSLTVSILLSMTYNWKMGLVTLVFTPISLLLFRCNDQLRLKENFYSSVCFNKAKEIIVETVTNAKCIAALTLEDAFLDKYRDEIKNLVLKNRRIGLKAFVSGWCVALPGFAYAISIFYGGYMLEKNEIETSKVFKVAEAIILGTLTVGHLLYFVPNKTKCQIAAVKLLRIIESPTSGSTKDDSKKLRGNVTFDAVSFQHPVYAGLPKLKSFSMEIKSGQSVGLVGRPNSGVSIPIELILGFYEVTSGKIIFDGERKSNFDTKNLRTQIGLVEGDPKFFKRSIADNINYGDLNRQISMREIVRVSGLAFIHDFVLTLPEGYATILDENVELTTSQKIRLSLARALLRNPKILLFLNLKRGENDESENILREAIKFACEERTSIASSNDPFSSIQLFSRIFFINGGIVEETGSHEELLKAGGFYEKLCRDLS